MLNRCLARIVRHTFNPCAHRIAIDTTPITTTTWLFSIMNHGYLHRCVLCSALLCCAVWMHFQCAAVCTMWMMQMREILHYSTEYATKRTDEVIKLQCCDTADCVRYMRNEDRTWTDDNLLTLLPFGCIWFCCCFFWFILSEISSREKKRSLHKKASTVKWDCIYNVKWAAKWLKWLVPYCRFAKWMFFM